MKKVITVTPIGRGKANEFIYSLVEAHNSGEDLNDKMGFLTSVAMYAKLNYINLSIDQDNDSATLKENGKETMSLHFKEVHELTEEEANKVHPLFQSIIDATWKMDLLTPKS